MFVVEKAKQERQEKIVQAEGEAEAATMISSIYLLLGLCCVAILNLFPPHWQGYCWQPWVSQAEKNQSCTDHCKDGK